MQRCRKMRKVKWTNKITNEEVWNTIREEKYFLKSKINKRSEFIGHIVRHEVLLKSVTELPCTAEKM